MMLGELSKAQPRRRFFTKKNILVIRRCKNRFLRSTKKERPCIRFRILRLISPSRISGCPFAPRCEFAQEKCVTSTIALKEIANDHFSACLRIELKEIDLTPAHLPENALARKVNY
jgi:ABC-type dipeptide/oligopeptide/nickel transport system ATPase component